MDWFTLILIVLFFVLPLVQQMLEQARRQQGGAPPTEAGEELERVDRVPRELPRAGRAPETDGEDASWSDEWMPWPTETPEEQDVPQKASAELEPAPRGLPQRIPAPEPRVDERADVLPESRRLEVWVEKSPERAQPVRLPTPIALPAPVTRARRPGTAPSVERAAASPLVRDLSNRQALRRAMVLKEVLGPPAAFRSLERELPG